MTINQLNIIESSHFEIFDMHIYNDGPISQVINLFSK